MSTNQNKKFNINKTYKSNPNRYNHHVHDLVDIVLYAGLKINSVIELLDENNSVSLSSLIYK